jgi:hypothetical protein
MTTRTKTWLKIAMTLLFIAVEVFAFSYYVTPAFEQPSLGHIVRAVGSQSCFVLSLLFLWFGERTRISWDAGWGALGLSALLFSFA